MWLVHPNVWCVRCMTRLTSICACIGDIVIWLRLALEYMWMRGMIVPHIKKTKLSSTIRVSMEADVVQEIILRLGGRNRMEVWASAYMHLSNFIRCVWFFIYIKKLITPWEVIRCVGRWCGNVRGRAVGAHVSRTIYCGQRYMIVPVSRYTSREQYSLS